MVKNSQPQGRDERRKKKKRRKIIGWIFIPILVAILTGLGWGIHLYIKAGSTVSDSYEDIGRGDEGSDYRVKDVDPGEDNVSVLIMGIDESDHRDNEGNARTDTLILATLNKKDKSVQMLSIPRDSLVHIPEIGREDKINHAHAYGGPKATIDTVEKLLEVPVDYHVTLNFNAFIQVVDALGGIELDVPYDFTESDSNDKRDSIQLFEGEHLLNGEEALALARTRKHDNDIERGKRQLEIIRAIMDKSISVGSVLKYDNMIDGVGHNMTTNMSFSEMKSFISYGTSGKDLDIESDTLGGTDYWPEDIYYWLIDEEALAETKVDLHDHLELEENYSVDKDDENKDSREASPAK